MNRIRSILLMSIILAVAVLIAVLSPKMTIAQGEVPQAVEADLGTAFTYQGHLYDGDSPANGSYNFRFYLWADQAKTTLLGTYPSIGTLPVDVSEGLFLVELDFGSQITNGQELWLEIEVNSALLSPLQRLNAAPYALGLRPGAVINGNLPSGMLNLENTSGDGLVVNSAGDEGVEIGTTGGYGVDIQSAGTSGIHVGSADATGVYVDQAGINGLGVGSATWYGLYVNQAGTGVYLDSTTYKGLQIDHAGTDGVVICATGNQATCTPSSYNNGVEIGRTQGYGLRIESSGLTGVYVAQTGANSSGFFVDQSGSNGVSVNSAGNYGLRVSHADGDGVFICSTGNQATCVPSSDVNGIEIGSTENHGISIDDAGWDGVYVDDAGDEGVYVSHAGENGMYVYEAVSYGLVVSHADADWDVWGDGVYANKNGTEAEWGINTPDKLYAGGGVTSNRLTLIARVGGDQLLAFGDLVSALGAADPLPENSMPLPLVGLASEGTSNGIIGVVEARIQRLAVPQSPEEQQAGREPIFTLRSVEGPARPGDYVAITVVGVAYVRVAPGVEIQPGQRLTASQVAGAARPLQTRTLEGMLVSEGAPVIGVALASPEAGSDTIPVFVSLR